MSTNQELSLKAISPDLLSQIKAIEGMPAIAEGEFKKAMSHVLPIVLSAWRAAAPLGVTGRTRSDVSTQVGGFGFRISGRVGYLSKTSVWYPNVVNYGRFEGSKMPPPSALLSWIEARLGLEGAEARRASFLISRAIARKGSRPGKQFMQKAKRVAQPAADMAFAVAGEEITKKLAVQSNALKNAGSNE